VKDGVKYQVTFSTKGSKFDTTMKVFAGTDANGKFILPSLIRFPNGPFLDESDNTKDGPWSEVTLTITAGPLNPHYLLVGVGGVDGAQGDIRISAKFSID
jgi:hypothetical protein